MLIRIIVNYFHINKFFTQVESKTSLFFHWTVFLNFILCFIVTSVSSARYCSSYNNYSTACHYHFGMFGYIFALLLFLLLLSVDSLLGVGVACFLVLSVHLYALERSLFVQLRSLMKEKK
jgi:hypothetical protein